LAGNGRYANGSPFRTLVVIGAGRFQRQENTNGGDDEPQARKQY
jgi:hypothetical protein